MNETNHTGLMFYSIFILSEWELLLCTIEDRNKSYRIYKYTLAPYWLYSLSAMCVKSMIIFPSPPSLLSALKQYQVDLCSTIKR